MKRAAWRDRKVAALFLYGLFVPVLALVALSRQVQLLQQIWGVGDPGITLKPAKDGPGWRVDEVAPGSPAAKILEVGDRVRQLGDLRQGSGEHALSDFWRYQARRVAPGQAVPVLFERGGERRRDELPFASSPLLEKRFAPGAQPLGWFLFAVFLPSRLMVWVYLVLGWVVLLRRPTSAAAQLFFLFGTTWAFTVSYWYVRPWDYPMPLRWLRAYPEVVRAWFPAFLAHLALVAPQAKPLYQRLGPRLAGAIYLPPVVITGLALLTTFRPDKGPTGLWGGPGFYSWYLFPYYLVCAELMAHSAVRASTSAGRRQARTMLLGFLLYLSQFTCTAVLHLSAFTGTLLGAILAPVAHLLFAVSFAFAILRQGLLDAGLLVRQGLVYGTVLAMGLAGYYVLVVVAGQLLLSVTRQTSPPAIMASALALALLLRPMTVYARRWVDRAFYRDRLETARGLRGMVQEMLSLLDRAAITAKLTSELPRVFPARSATLFLLDTGDRLYRPVGAPSDVPALSAEESLILSRLQQSGRPVTTYDVEMVSSDEPLTLADREVTRRSGAVLWVPLLLGDRLTGALALGWKASEEVYTEEDIDALCLIANEAAIALENASLSEEREQQARLQQELAIGHAIGHAIQKRLLSLPQTSLPG